MRSIASSASLATEGMTILLAEQNAAMALGVADRAYVLEFGPHFAQGRGRGAQGNRRGAQALSRRLNANSRFDAARHLVYL